MTGTRPKANPKIVVFGLWHLGCVTAASLAQEHFPVCGLDLDATVIQGLQNGKPPVFEPGLTELIEETRKSGALQFTSDPKIALADADVMWVTFDTPVDAEDHADVGFVERQLDAVFPYLKSGTIILISSQLPVGSTGALRQRWLARDPEKKLIYGYSPENLRLGKALKTLRAEDRIVVGMNEPEGRERIQPILSRFCPRIEWMSVESAEMTKHALNSFLAVSVAMANEIARLCERTGADAKEVERGLKSESRIGPGAYLGPGGPFAGGTLARDLRFLTQLGTSHGLQTPLLSGTLASNELHKNWVRETTMRLLEGVPGPARVTLLGLTYKAGTDTLRRSEAVKLGLWLAELGLVVTVHDPVVGALPEDIAGRFRLTDSVPDALTGADLLIVCTGWPIYREEVNPEMLRKTMRRVAVIDETRFLAGQLEGQTGIPYRAVGKPWSPIS